MLTPSGVNPWVSTLVNNMRSTWIGPPDDVTAAPSGVCMQYI
jgi:hypothetical protein